MDVVLILTGCVVPNCNDCLSVKDVVTRKQMYVDSITWYLENTPYDIVFCENSETDLSNYFPDINRLEIMTFKDSASPTEDQSKSSKELAILEYAYRHSKKIKSGKLFVKITGRLKYLNLVQTINRLRFPPDLRLEYICSDFGMTNIWSDSRFFFFTYPFFKRMFSKQKLININFEFERMLGTCIYQLIQNQEGTFEFLPLPQRVSGISGGYGIRYDISNLEYYKRLFKHSLTKLMFDLHVFPRIKKVHILKYGNK